MRDEESEKMKNEKVAKGRIIGLAGPCLLIHHVNYRCESRRLLGRLAAAAAAQSLKYWNICATLSRTMGTGSHRHWRRRRRQTRIYRFSTLFVTPTGQSKPRFSQRSVVGGLKKKGQ